MIVAGRRDYALMTGALLGKRGEKAEKCKFLEDPGAPVNTGDGVVLS